MNYHANEEEEFQDYIDEENDVPQQQERDFSQNNVSLSFSWSLMNQLRNMSKMEGIPVETLLIELVSEGVAKRVFEDQSRTPPSHLLTRNGYVHTDERQIQQPQMSHHVQRQGQNNGSSQNRNKFHFQSRNSNGNFNSAGKNQSRGTYQLNNRNQNNFRNASYNQQQKIRQQNQSQQLRSTYHDEEDEELRAQKK